MRRWIILTLLLLLLPLAGWAADTTILVPTGQLLDAESLTVGANTVIRQRLQIVGTTATSIAAVLNAPPATSAWGLVTRPIWTTPLGDSLIDDAANIDAFRVTNVSVVTTQYKTATNKTWYIAAADPKTDFALVTVAAGTLVRVYTAAVICSNANTVDVSAQIGFGATTVPARSASGATGAILDHPKIPPGGGYVRKPASVVEGTSDQDLRLTLGDPVGGACAVTVDYETLAS